MQSVQTSMKLKMAIIIDITTYLLFSSISHAVLRKQFRWKMIDTTVGSYVKIYYSKIKITLTQSQKLTRIQHKFSKRIILDEYEAISKTLQEYQEKIETIQQLANQFRQQIGSVILFADNHGLKGKCIVNIWPDG